MAELARLIGQNDPFADFERSRVRGGAETSAPAPEPPPENWPAHPASGEPYYHAEAPQPEGYAQLGPAESYAPHPDQGYGYPADAYQEGYQPYYDPYSDPDGSFDEADYLEEQERKRRRRPLVAMAAILALVILGGAGAYGYRTFFGAATSDSPPPVIKADTTPTKVMPETQASDAGSNKLIYDRVGESQGDREKIVPREEKPVDIKTATVSPGPSNGYSAPSVDAVAAPPSATIPVSGQSPTGQVLPVASEPTVAARGTGAILPSAKKVRTLTIRPDMTIVPNTAARSVEPEPPSVPQSVQPTEPPAPTEPSTARSAPNPASSPAPSPTPPPPASPAPSQQAANAPLSLSPDAVASPAPAPARSASSPARQPMALATAPAATSNEPRATSGGFTVQVSSQRSEAEAEAAYRTLRARYPNILGGHSSFVRRADLGSRGIYYRTMVGPFATAAQAGQLCSSLKAAGGQCIIHRN